MKITTLPDVEELKKNTDKKIQEQVLKEAVEKRLLDIAFAVQKDPNWLASRTYMQMRDDLIEDLKDAGYEVKCNLNIETLEISW